MKQEIIDQMQAHLGSGKLAQSDFRIDVKRLEDYDGEFFWMSRENGTSLSKISYDRMNKLISDSSEDKAQANRMAWFQDFYVFIAILEYYSEYEDAKFFYYDGNRLAEVKYSVLKHIYDDKFTRMYRELKRDYKHEYDVVCKKLPIKLSCRISTLKEALYYAESIGDTSLLVCLHGLRKYRRIAVNQDITIYSDFTKHGFTFSENVNGQSIMGGGIIHHGYKKNNRWQIHT